VWVVNSLLTSQAFGVFVASGAYLFGAFLYRKTRFPLFTPILVATLVIILFLELSGIALSAFLGSIQSIQLFLGPLIVSLAVPIVKQIDLIKKHILPIVVGSIVGAIASMGSIIILGPLFGLTPELVASIIPKSATTPIAVEVADMLQGIRSIAVFVVVITAVIAAVTFPTLFKWLKLKDPVVIGMTFGANAHALGTAKAIEIDPVAGAISGIALVFSGIATALIALFL
jgi:putative effector of murein hydrolase